MVPKRDITEYSMHQSDALDSWCTFRDHKALLRSTGHLFRDGRWLGEDHPFHVFRELESPAFGPNKTFEASPNYLRAGSSDPFGYERVDCNWKPAISRSFSSGFFDPELYGYFNLPDVVESDFSDFVLALNAQGTSYIRQTRPGNPIVNLGQYMIELRELPRVPIFMERRAKKFKDLGSEYLNVEFGWKPFIKDLILIYEAQSRIQKMLTDLRKNNGLSVRRRSKKKVFIETSELCSGTLTVPFGRLDDESIGGNVAMEGYSILGPFGGYGTYTWPGHADYDLYVTKYRTEWNVATWKYYVPDIGSSQWTERAIKELYGSELTPSVIWSVIPWTWLADWFANVGDIISNLSTNAVDNETLTNTFAMYAETTYTVAHVVSEWPDIDSTATPGNGFFLPAGQVDLKHTITRIDKFRQESSPFGFGLKREDFTSRQLAILAALLVSKAKPLSSKDQTLSPSLMKRLAKLLR